ncbi:glycosyltransferase family 4 protein [Patescibacteria group bacterium]|nr:glycosyltransferase family 4 protein [Patescibacteria group bacterium]
MKKILIATIEFPPQKGGIANYLAGLAKALPADRVAVLAEKYEGAQKFDNRQSYKIYRKKLFANFLWPKWLPMIWHLWREARREKVEVILVGQVLPVGTAAMIVKNFFKIPYFVSCHGMDILSAAENSRKKKLVNKILEQAVGVVANSEFTKNELIKLGVSENKITVIYPCVDDVVVIAPEKISEIKNRLGLADKKIILTIGRLVARKGQDKVIEAIPKILEKIPNALYVIIGDGPERKNLELRIMNYELENNVLLLGEVSEEKKNAFYQLCDIFVMTPRQIGADVEGFGTVYLEANKFGKPVVAGRSGGVAEAVADGVTGIVVDPENINQISEVVIKILSDEGLAKKLGEEGRERAEKEFRWEVQVVNLKKFID